MRKLMMAMGLLALSSLGTGCDGEPEGSCTTREASYNSDFGTTDFCSVCRENSTASACTAAGGTFDEGGACFPFDLSCFPG
jgi:hypothetical protein